MTVFPVDKSAGHLSYLALLMVLLVILWAFCASSGEIQWMDNGFFISEAAQGNYFVDKLGALTHPFYHFVMTLIFSVGGVVATSYFNAMLLLPTAFVMYRLCRALGHDRFLSLLAILLAFLAHSVFWIATKVEVYLLDTLLILIAYWVVMDPGLRMSAGWRMCLCGLLLGLGVSTHQLTFLLMMPLGLYALAVFRLQCLWFAPGFLLGIFACYPALANDLSSGHDLLEIVRGYLTGHSVENGLGYESSLFRFDRIFTDKVYVALLILSLLGLQGLGLLPYFRTRQLAIIWMAAIVNLLFAVSYGVSDRFTFFLPGVFFLAIMSTAFIGRFSRRRMTCVILLIMALLPALMLVSLQVLSKRGLVVLPMPAVTLPYRDDVKYFLVPYMKEISAQIFVDEYEKLVPAGALVLADWSPLGALRAAQASGRFLGRELVDCAQVAPGSEFGRHGKAAYLVRMDYCQDVLRIRSVTRERVGYSVTLD